MPVPQMIQHHQIKEKLTKMVNITKKILVMASAAMAFAGLASATATCTLVTPTVKIIRAEGTSELLAPLVFSCTSAVASPGVAVDSAATTGTLNVSLPGTTITSKVLDASAGKTEVVAVVSSTTVGASTPVVTAASTVFGTVTAGNINFNGLAIPQLFATACATTCVATQGSATFTITVNNIRVNGGLVAAAGSIPVINVSGYIVSANAASVPLTLFAGGQYAYIQNGLAAPAFYPTYTTAAAGGFAAGAVASGDAGKKNAFTTCTTVSPVADAVNLVNYTVTPSGSNATPVPTAIAAGSSMAFAVRVSSNFAGAFKAKGASVGSGEQSDVLVTSGLNTNAVANGTRFQISFPTLPAGVSVYVPSSIIFANGNGSVSSIQLSTSAAGTAHVAAAPSTNSDVWNATTKGSSALALVSGTAVFEVQSDGDLTPAFDIPVFVVAKANTVAPGSTISATVGFSPNGSTAIPNFAAGTATVGGSAFSACSTSLLFPFVSNQLGFDVGVVIANTSSDPTNLLKLNQSGTCSLNFYGDGAPATAASTGTVAAGQVYAALLSGVAPGFQGYMVAKCDFQYAHGFAYINYGLGTSAGVTTGYLANVIGTGTRTFTNSNETLGN